MLSINGLLLISVDEMSRSVKRIACVNRWTDSERAKPRLQMKLIENKAMRWMSDRWYGCKWTIPENFGGYECKSFSKFINRYTRPNDIRINGLRFRHIFRLWTWCEINIRRNIRSFCVLIFFSATCVWYRENHQNHRFHYTFWLLLLTYIQNTRFLVRLRSINEWLMSTSAFHILMDTLQRSKISFQSILM